MAKPRRKLTPAQRKVALRNLAKARAARKSKTTGRKPRKRRTDRERKSLGYRKEKPMAAKKRRRRAAPKRRRSSSRRSGGGGGRGILSGIPYMDMAGAGAYGWLEKQVGEKGDEAWLKKVPLFFDGIGYAGCSAILAHIVGKNVGGTLGKAARHYANGTFNIAAYKLMKNGKLYESKAEAEAALAGDDDLSGDDEFTIGVDDDDLGADDDDLGYGADGIAGDDDY